MLLLLDAIVSDPSPGASVGAAVTIRNGAASHLGEKQHAALDRMFDGSYDETNAGWGNEHKYVDASALEWSLAKFDRGDRTSLQRVLHTLDANRNLIDPIWGGVYQYSDAVDWKSPHFEKLLAFQADDLRLYSDAYSRWHRQNDLEAAKELYGYLTKFLGAPDGGFYVSQDADVSEQISGREFYARDATARRAAGMPRIDKHEYSREAGWVIRALCKYYDVTGDMNALDLAKRGARWAQTARSLPGGGFRHGAADRAGPFLEDNVSMAGAFVALYRSTGQREWLRDSIGTLDFIEAQLRDPRSGYVASPADKRAHGVFRQPIRDAAQNASLVRVANMVHHYTGAERQANVALHGMRFLTAFVTSDSDQFRPEILLADRELSQAPVHITVVGRKDDAAAQVLHAAALRYPDDYLQVDWWDRRDGKLPNPAITYPVLNRAAAFACTADTCSTPVFDASELAARVRAILN